MPCSPEEGMWGELGREEEGKSFSVQGLWYEGKPHYLFKAPAQGFCRPDQSTDAVWKRSITGQCMWNTSGLNLGLFLRDLDWHYYLNTCCCGIYRGKEETSALMRSWGCYFLDIISKPHPNPFGSPCISVQVLLAPFSRQDRNIALSQLCPCGWSNFCHPFLFPCCSYCSVSVTGLGGVECKNFSRCDTSPSWPWGWAQDGLPSNALPRKIP